MPFDPVDSAQHWLDRSAALMRFLRTNDCVIAFDEGVWGFKANARATMHPIS